MGAFDDLTVKPPREDWGALTEPTPEELDKQRPSILDVAKQALGVGLVADTARGIGFGLEKAGVDYGTRMRKSGDWLEGEILESMTPAGRRAAQSQVFEGDGITDLRPTDKWGQALVMGAARSVPQMAAMAPVGVPLALGARAAIPAAAMRAPGAGGVVARNAPGAIGFGTAEGLQAGALGGAQMQSEIEGISVEELAERSPRFRELAATMGPDEAKAALADEAARRVAGQTALWTGGVGALTGGGAMGELVRPGAKGFLRGVTRGGISEAGQEIPQSGGEEYIANLARRDALDPGLDPWTGVPAAAATGGAIALPTGGAVGGAAHLMNRRPDPLQAARDALREAQPPASSAPAAAPGAAPAQPQGQEAAVPKAEESVAAVAERTRDNIKARAAGETVEPSSTPPAFDENLKGPTDGNATSAVPAADEAVDAPQQTGQAPDAQAVQAQPAVEVAPPEGAGTRDDPVKVKSSADIEAAAKVARADYTPPQGEANNIQRAHVDWDGLEGTLEVAANGVRKGTNPKTGEAWETTHTAPYGYWKGTKGADGMHVDVIWGPEVEADHPVYVLDEIEPGGKFRQHKTLAGFPSEQAAREAYLGISSKRPEHIGAVTAMPREQFKTWLKGDTTKPVAYKPQVSDDELRAAVRFGDTKEQRDAARAELKRRKGAVSAVQNQTPAKKAIAVPEKHHATLRAWAQQEWFERGGRAAGIGQISTRKGLTGVDKSPAWASRDEMNAEGRGRTQWVGAPFTANSGMTKEDAIRAVEKAIAGKPLGERQQRLIEGMLAEAEEADRQFAELRDELAAEGRSAEEQAADIAAVENAPLPDDWSKLSKEEEDARLDEIFGAPAKPAAQGEGVGAQVPSVEVGPDEQATAEREPGSDDEPAGERVAEGERDDAGPEGGLEREAGKDEQTGEAGRVLENLEPQNSPEYDAALAASREASRRFQKATDDYRARRIGDAEYLAARKEHDEAIKVFDEAYAAEKKRQKRQAPSVAQQGRMSYSEAVAENMRHMGTDPKEWSALPIEGFENVQDDTGRDRKLPKYTFPSGYSSAPSMFTGKDECRLCGTPIKRHFWIKNDPRKWLLNVGSECVTHFNDGESGEELAAKTVHAQNRQFLADFITSRRALWNAYKSRQHLGYDRWETRIGNATLADLNRAMVAMIGNMVAVKELLGGEPSSDGAITRWVNKNRDAASDLKRKADIAVELKKKHGHDRFDFAKEWAAEIKADARPSLDLTAQTEADLKKKQDELDAAAKKKAEEEAAAEAKKKADAQAATFALTGSERPADANPGQGSLFNVERKGKIDGMADDDSAAVKSSPAAAGDRRLKLRDLHKQRGVTFTSADVDRGGAHSPADPESGSPAYDVALNGTYPEDFYGPEGLRYYGTGYEALDAEMYWRLRRMAGRPNTPITVYRAVEKDGPSKIQPGDWVTPIRQYAKEHGEGAINGNYKIIKKLVHARDIWTAGDSMLEWGYHPQPFLPEVRPNKPLAGDLPPAHNFEDYRLAEEILSGERLPPIQVGKKLERLRSRLDKGEITERDFVQAVDGLILALRNRAYAREVKKITAERATGADWLKERLIRAKRHGELPEAQIDFALWLLDRAPWVAEGLGISVKGEVKEGSAGQYSPAGRVAILVSSSTGRETAVHEILHHTERMMPVNIRNGILTEYEKQFKAAWKKASPTERKVLSDMLLAQAGDEKARKRFSDAIIYGAVDKPLYQFANPSEFWAVNGSRILGDRYDARGWVKRARAWLREFIEKVKSVFGFKSDAPVIKALNAVLGGDGKFVSDKMLMEAAETLDAVAPKTPEVENVESLGRRTLELEDAIGKVNKDMAALRALPARKRADERWTTEMRRLEEEEADLRKALSKARRDLAAAEKALKDVPPLEDSRNQLTLFNIEAGRASAWTEAPRDESAYIGWDDYYNLLKNPYVKDGAVIANSRMMPNENQFPKPGAWRIATVEGSYGREIEQLVEVPVEKLILGELDSKGRLDPTKAGDDERYAKWLEEGRRAPPIEVVQTDNGTLSVTDGHRRALAAKRAGRATIEAWVNYAVPVPSGGRYNGDPKAKFIRTGLTFEMLTGEVDNPYVDERIRFARGAAGTMAPAYVTHPEDQDIVDLAAKAVSANVEMPTRLEAVRLVDGGDDGSARGANDPGAGQADAIADFDASRKIAEFFGRKLVLFKHLTGFEFNGLSYPDERSRLNGFVFINVAAKHPFLAVTGHELLHTMRKDAPDAYLALRSALLPFVRNTEQYKAARNMEGADMSLVIEEIMADTIGDRMMERAFWEDLAGRKPTVFEKIARFVMEFLNRIVSRGRGLGSEKYIADLDATRKAVAEAVLAYGSKKGEVRELAMEILESPAVKYSREWADAGEPMFARRIFRDGYRTIRDFIVPETPEYDGNMTGDLAYVPTAAARNEIEALPIRLNVGQEISPHVGHGISHMKANADRDSKRAPVAETGDQAEDLARDLIKVLRSPVQMFDDGPGKVVLRSMSEKRAVVLQRKGGNDAYYGVVTVRPAETNVWGSPVWSGRLTFPELSLGGSEPPNQSIGQTATEANPERAGVQTEKFDFTRKQPKIQYKGAGRTPGSKEEPIRFSRVASISAFQRAPGVSNFLAGLFNSPSSLGIFNGLNTQYHKGVMLARKGKPQFKAVFDKVQEYLNDISAIATAAEQKAPAIFRELKGITPKEIAKHFKGAAKDSDIQAIAPWLYRGTLYGGASPMEGVVWTDDELRGKKGSRILPNAPALTDQQVELYKQARAAIDQAMEDGAKSIIHRHVKRHGVEFDKTQPLDKVADSVVEQLQERKEEAKLRLAAAADEADAAFEAYTAAKEKADQTKGRTDRVNAEAAKVEWDKAESAIKKIEADVAILDSLLGDDENPGTIRRIEKQANDLAKHGYMPLKRFGTRTVTAKDEDGKVMFFGVYDGTPLVPGSANREMHEAAKALREMHPTWTVTTGVKSEKSWMMYQGLSIDALENFLDFLDPETKAELERDNTIQEYLKNAVNNRSVMKELIHRKGTPGFSQDVPRVLASFVTSHARNASGLFHIGEAKKLVDAIPNSDGDIKDEATELVEYVTEPGEEAAKLRGFLFFHFLGGSIAAAAVNLTQTPLMTLPHLAKYASAKDVAAKLTEAAKSALLDPAKMQGDIGWALQKAENDGITAPQQIHHLTATAANNPFSSNRHFRTFMTAWGGLFSAAEVFNRRVAFIAAFNIAKGKGMKNAEAYEFSKTAVVETQGLYNKANRPNLFRGTVGSLVGTFKTFSVLYLELLRRLPPQQQLLMLGMLLLVAGAEGLPFEQDIADMVDTLGQWLGFTTNTGRWTGKMVADTLGEDLERPILKGLGGMLPLDLHSRLGMGNLLPATAFLKQSEVDKTRDVAEAVGPLGGVLQSLSQSIQMLARGRWDKAAVNAAPKAVRDAYNGLHMAVTGESQDQKGRLAMEGMTKVEGFGKAIGFNPRRAAEEGEARREITQDRNLRTVRMDEIASDWADGILRDDTKKQDDARERLSRWNEDNPDMPIGREILRSVRQRVITARLTTDQRFLKSTPRAMRQAAQEELSQ